MQNKLDLFHQDNPLKIKLQVELACQECLEHGEKPLVNKELQLDISLTIDEKTLNGLLERYFKDESIEGFNCTKCSMRKYLEQFQKGPADDQQGSGGNWTNIPEELSSG